MIYQSLSTFLKKEAPDIELKSYENVLNLRVPTRRVYDQREKTVDQGSCIAMAIANAIEAQSGGHWLVDPISLYEDTKKLEKRQNDESKDKSGTSFESVAIILQSVRYIKNIILLSDVDEILTWLVNFGIPAIAVKWYEGFSNPKGMWKNRFMEAKGRVVGKHALALIGIYQPIFKNVHLLLENSWGYSWGNEGKALLDIDSLEKTLLTNQKTGIGFTFKTVDKSR